MLKHGLATKIAAFGLMGASMTLSANPITVNDYDGNSGYIGADATGTNETYYGDVVGNDSDFDISSMVVNQNGTQFDFTINTAFAGKSGQLFNDETIDLDSDGNRDGIGYGDLFLANNWDPNGDSPYLQDNAATGTDWTWGLILNDRFANKTETQKGTVSLARLPGSNLETALLSDDLMKGNPGEYSEWRYGQEVIVDTGTEALERGWVELVQNEGGLGSWWVGQGQLNISFDLGQTDLLNGNKLAFHWGMTCANDVIEGEVDLKKVPEPGTIGLVSLALVALFIMRRRSKAA